MARRSPSTRGLRRDIDPAILEIARALAREQARRDHEARLKGQQYEDGSDLRPLLDRAAV